MVGSVSRYKDTKKNAFMQVFFEVIKIFFLLITCIYQIFVVTLQREREKNAL